MTPAMYDWMINGAGNPMLDMLFIAGIAVNAVLFTYLGINKPPGITASLRRIKAAAYGVLALNFSYLFYKNHDLIISVPSWLGWMGVIMCDFFYGLNRLTIRIENANKQ